MEYDSGHIEKISGRTPSPRGGSSRLKWRNPLNESLRILSQSRELVFTAKKVFLRVLTLISKPQTLDLLFSTIYIEHLSSEINLASVSLKLQPGSLVPVL